MWRSVTTRGFRPPCRSWLLGVFLLSASASIACGTDDEQAQDPFTILDEDPSFPGTPGDPASYASLFQFDPLAGCAVSNPTNLGLERELRLFKGPGVTDADVRRFLSGLQRYYSQYGISMSTRHDVIDVPFREAMILDMNLLEPRVMAETGIDMTRPVSAEDEARVTSVLGAAMFHNVREFIRVYAEPRRDFVDVLFLDEMVSRNLPAELERFRGIAGLGLSPELLAHFPPGDPAAQLYQWFGVTEDFTPVAVIGVSPVETYLNEPDIVMAHEIGHTYGLIHTMASGNLLNQGELDCWLELDSTQLEEIRLATGAVAHGVGVEALSLTSRAGEFVGALRELVRGGR